MLRRYKRRNIIETLALKAAARVLKLRDAEKALSLYEPNSDTVNVVLLEIGVPKIGGWEVVPEN